MYRFSLLILTCICLFSCKNGAESNKDSKNKPDSGQHMVNEMTHVITQYPDSMPLKVQLIDLLDSMKKYDDAVKNIDCLIIKDRFNNNLWLRKGQILREKGDTVKAIDAFNHSVSIYPSPDVLLELANLYAEKRDPKALAICDNLKKMGLGQTNDSYASFFQGVYFARTHQREKAQQYFDMAINDNYTFPDAYLEKGFLFYEINKYDDALKIFTKLSMISNANANAYYWIAKCEEAKNNKEEALINYQKAYGLDKSIIEAKAAMIRLSK